MAFDPFLDAIAGQQGPQQDQPMPGGGIGPGVAESQMLPVPQAPPNGTDPLSMDQIVQLLGRGWTGVGHYDDEFGTTLHPHASFPTETGGPEVNHPFESMAYDMGLSDTPPPEATDYNTALRNAPGHPFPPTDLGDNDQFPQTGKRQILGGVLQALKTGGESAISGLVDSPDQRNMQAAGQFASYPHWAQILLKSLEAFSKIRNTRQQMARPYSPMGYQR